MPDIYVVVAENDQEHKNFDGATSKNDDGPIVFETYTRCATIDFARNKAKLIAGAHGKCRIAKLQFIDEE